MSTVSSYLKQMLGYLKGDNAQIVAAKNERKANSALKGQIAALEAKQVDDESNVEDKKEALNKAYFPLDVITDNQSYIRNIVRAKESLDAAEDSLQATKESIEFFKNLVKEFAEQVTAE